MNVHIVDQGLLFNLPLFVILEDVTLLSQFHSFNPHIHVPTVVKWLDCRNCNHKVVGLNPTKVTADFTVSTKSVVI